MQLSALHQLSAEIRRQIWDEVYPTQTVHLEFSPSQRAGKAVCCVAKGTEEEAYAAWVQQALRNANGQVPKVYRHRHSDCRSIRYDDGYVQTGIPEMDLRPLRTSKAFKDEIEEAIYRNTIFACGDAKTFSIFLTGRSRYQTSHIRGLMLQCDWSAWTDGKEWEAETKMDRLRTLTGLKRLHIYIGGPFPDELTCVWERFQVCPLKTATVTVQKNGSQVYSYIGQSTVDACEGMISTMLTDWSESDGRQRLAKLEARIATEREAVDRSMSLNGYERPGEDWFG